MGQAPELVLRFAELASRSRDCVEVNQALQIADLPEGLQESFKAARSAVVLARSSPEELGTAILYLHPSGFTGGLRDAILVLLRMITDFGYLKPQASDSKSGQAS